MLVLLFVVTVRFYLLYLDFPVTVISTFKFFAANYKDYLTESLVFMMTTALSFGNGVFRTVWGLFFDKLDFKILMSISFGMQIICAGSFYFCAKIPALVFILMIIVSMIAASSFCLLPASVYKKYGTKIGSEIYSVVFIAFGFASVLGPSLSKILDLSHAENTTPYAILYEGGVVTALIGLLLIYLLDITPVYDYKELVEEDNNSSYTKAKSNNDNTI